MALPLFNSSIEHGKLEALRAKYGITADAAMEKLKPFLAVRVQTAAVGERSKA